MNINKPTVFIVFFLGLLLLGCNSKTEFKNNELNTEDKIDQSTPLIDESLINAMNISEKSKKWSIQLYKKLDYHSIWVEHDSLSSTISSFFDYVNSDTSLNIPLEYFSTSSYTEQANSLEKEVITALRCAEFLSLKDTTIINQEKNIFNQSAPVLVEAFIEFLENKKNTDPWEVHLLKDRKSTRLNSSHVRISYAVFCLKK